MSIAHELHQTEPSAVVPMSGLFPAGLLVLAGLFAAAAIAYVNDGDLSWQRALGEYVLREHHLPTTLGSASLSAPLARWFPHEWMFATILALAERSNMDVAFRLGCASIACATILIDALRARHCAPIARLVALLLIATTMFPSFGARAQIVAWPLLAITMVVLEASPRRSWLLISIAVAWYNVHASGLLIPVIVIVHGIGRALTERRPARLGGPALLALACSFASTATPFGFAYASFAATWTLNPATDLIAEWQHITLPTLPFFSGAFLMVALLVIGERRGVRLTWSQRLLALGFLCAALIHVRNLALFGIVAGPWSAAALASFLPAPVVRAQAGARRMSWSDCSLLVFGAIGGIVVTLLGASIAHDPADDAARAIAQLAGEHRARRVACEDFGWCSQFASAPSIHVFLDGRLDAYPARVFADYRRLRAGDTAGIFDRWQIDTVLAHRDGALAQRLRRSGWRCQMTGETEIFVRVY